MRRSASTPRRSDLPGIQILRGIACLAVIIHHALGEPDYEHISISPDWLTTALSASVDTFFVISGFIMVFIAFRPDRKPPRPGTFMLRRIERVYPMYWLGLCAVLILAWAGFLRSRLWTAIDLPQIFLLLPYPKALMINISWTLFYEMYFYAIFAATLAFASRRATVLCVTLVTIGLAGVAIFRNGSFAIFQYNKGVFTNQEYHTLDSFLANPVALEFSFGMLLAIFFSRVRTVDSRLYLVGFACFAVTSAIIPHPTTDGLTGIARLFAWGLPAALVVWSFLSIGYSDGPITRFGILMGDASYSLYLSHPFVMMIYAGILRHTALRQITQYPIVPVVVMVAVSLGIIIHLKIERPLLQYLQGRRRSGGV